MTACPGDERIAALADGALPEPERAELETHLADCSPCARIVAELARLVTPGPPSDALLGRYEVVEPVGSGGMGLVVEAWDPVLSRRVAIKIVRPDKPIARDRLLAEARALAQLSDPHVLAIHDVIDSERGVCLVTELVDGDSAAGWCERVRPSWPEVRDLYLQVARGLLAVHARGLLHRDIKPANVLVGRDGRARLADFGLTGDGTAALGGTPGFMAPEQAAGRTIDVRADQFALAMSMIHGFAGRLVPAGATAAELHALGIPTAASGALARAIAASPGARFDRIAELMAALAPAVPRRGRWLAIAGGLAAVTLGVVGWRTHTDGAIAGARVDPGAPTPVSDATSFAAAPRDADRSAPRDAAPIVSAPRDAASIVSAPHDAAPRAVAIAHPAPSKAVLEAALERALTERDARGCATALGPVVALEPRLADRFPYCEMLAGRCQAGIAMLARSVAAAAATGIANDYCPADGDLADHRLGRALAQATAGRTPASCQHRATWVTTLATSPDEAQLYAVNAIECFAAIGRCADATAEADVLAALRSTTSSVELARVAPACAR